MKLATVIEVAAEESPDRFILVGSCVLLIHYLVRYLLLQGWCYTISKV